jgi:hypothetical protein
MRQSLPNTTPEWLAAEKPKIKVLYLAGWGRSGSTILSNILGELDGFFSAGEINNLWDRGLLDDRLCGCGQNFSRCEFWPIVFTTAFGGLSGVDAKRYVELENSLRTPDLWLSLLPGGASHLSSRLQGYVEVLEQLYQAIQKTADCPVIVDASKNPVHAYLLSIIPTIDLYVVHLVRDPRGVAYSWVKKKSYDPDRRNPSYMDQHSPLYSTLIWSLWNLTIDRLWSAHPQYRLLHYEEFVRQPRQKVGEIVRFCGEQASALPFVSDHEVALHCNHNVSGNPSRFQYGHVRLTMDDAWKTEMKARDKTLIRLLFYPLVRRYGYAAETI